METTIAVIVIAILAFLGSAATRPGTYHVERSTSITGRPETIFSLINDFHRWAEWSPFEKFDPNMQKTFGGAHQGSGATYEWAGNSKAGKGRMEIIGSTPPSNVRIQLNFEKPFPSK